MFERITIGKQRCAGEPIDLGSLAECLLYYESVELLADDEVIIQLLNACGPDTLYEFVANRGLNIHLEMDTKRIETKEHDNSLHAFAVFRGAWPPGAMKDHTFKQENEILQFLYSHVLGQTRQSINHANRLGQLVQGVETEVDLLRSTFSDYMDEAFIAQSARRIISEFEPNVVLPNDFFFKIEPNNDGQSFYVRTNWQYDYNAVGSIVPENVLAVLLTTRQLMNFSALRNSELSVNQVYSSIISNKLDRVVKKYTHSNNQIRTFHEVLIPEARCLREVINSGERSLDEVLVLLDHAKKFKEWMRGLPLDVNLITQFHNEIASKSWFEKVIPKTTRLVLFNALGIGIDEIFDNQKMLGNLAGLALSAADTFLLEHILKKWKPDQFINGQLKPFLMNARN